MPKSEKPLTCAHGTPWEDCLAYDGGCLGCQEESRRLEMEFERDVLSGRCCWHGYTPNEAKRARHECKD